MTTEQQEVLFKNRESITIYNTDFKIHAQALSMERFCEKKREGNGLLSNHSFGLMIFFVKIRENGKN